MKKLILIPIVSIVMSFSCDNVLKDKKTIIGTWGDYPSEQASLSSITLAFEENGKLTYNDRGTILPGLDRNNKINLKNQTFDGKYEILSDNIVLISIKEVANGWTRELAYNYNNYVVPGSNKKSTEDADYITIRAKYQFADEYGGKKINIDFNSSDLKKLGINENIWLYKEIKK
jgi:hypothetical protein